MRNTGNLSLTDTVTAFVWKTVCKDVILSAAKDPVRLDTDVNEILHCVQNDNLSQTQHRIQYIQEIRKI